MDVYVYNTSFQLVSIIDSFESFIWTERYSDYGDFELYVAPNSEVLRDLQSDYYVFIRDSDRAMIIEDIQIDVDVDNGSSLKVSGRSLESILDRRIVWKQTIISDKTVDEVIKQLLDENVINPSDSSRRIDMFEYDDLHSNHYIKTLKISQIQFTGDNLFDAIKGICDAFNLGFRVIISGTEAGDPSKVKMKFQLFVGENRSYENDDGTEQFKNPCVVFSPSFDNLLNSSYLMSKKNYKTVTLIAGEGEGVDRYTVVAPGGYTYTLLTSRPNDWATNFKKYYTKTSDNGSERYMTVVGVDSEPAWKTNVYYNKRFNIHFTYTELTEEPDDWENKYSNYYVEKSPKGSGEYEQITSSAAPGWNTDRFFERSFDIGESLYVYDKLTEQPSDWTTSYSKYYKYSEASNSYVSVTKEETPPTWTENTYYATIPNENSDTGSGLTRRELFTDARDITRESSTTSGSTITLTDAEYESALIERGTEKLTEYNIIESFEGSVDPSTQYKYGSLEDIKMGLADYSIGDIVQVENEYGMRCRCRVTEFIRSEDSSGSETYPTFVKIQ